VIGDIEKAYLSQGLDLRP